MPKGHIENDNALTLADKAEWSVGSLLVIFLSLMIEAYHLLF
jgi:hypothetical protein